MGITLYYFDMRGWAEPIRMILSYAGEPFEDVRVPRPTHCVKLPADMKSKFTWGQVPFVEFDGKKLAQSLAITRYFARKHGLVPEDDYEAAQCDEYVDAIRDMVPVWHPPVFEKDETLKKEKVKVAYDTSKPRFFDVFESILEKNGGKHLVGKGMTWADIYLAFVLDNIDVMLPELDVTKEYPALKTLKETVLSQPGIKTWLEKRPATEF